MEALPPSAEVELLPSPSDRIDPLLGMLPSPPGSDPVGSACMRVHIIACSVLFRLLWELGRTTSANLIT